MHSEPKQGGEEEGFAYVEPIPIKPHGDPYMQSVMMPSDFDFTPLPGETLIESPEAK